MGVCCKLISFKNGSGFIPEVHFAYFTYHYTVHHFADDTNLLYLLYVRQGSSNGDHVLGQRTHFCEKNMEASIFTVYRHVIYR